MLNANELLKKGLEQVRAAGIVPGKIEPNVVINSRAKGRFGLCKKRGKSYIIELNVLLLEVEEKKAMNTMVHEILHTCEGCMNHGPRWKSYANIMNRKYGYNITTCSTYEKFGLEEPKSKYVLKCKNGKCGHEHRKARMSASVKNHKRYRCGKCNGALSLIINGVLQAETEVKVASNSATTTRPKTQPEKQTAMVANSTAKYIIKCTKCEIEYPRKRMSNAIKNINNYKCRCGGKLVVL